MPSPADFKKAFGFETGSEVCPQVIIERAHIGHEVIQKNEKYEFPSTLDLSFPTKSVSRCDLLTTLRGYAGKRPKIIYSSYGSPYACQVHGWKIISFLNEAGTAHARFLGKAVRRRDIPTLAQQSSMQRDRKRKKAGPSPSPNGKTPQNLETYFNSSNELELATQLMLVCVRVCHPQRLTRCSPTLCE